MSVDRAAGRRYDEVIKGLLGIHRVRLSRTRERERRHHTEVLQRLAEAQRELRLLRQRLKRQLGRE